MLKKIKGVEIKKIEGIKLVKITDKKWSRKCFYCKLFFPSKDRRKKYWIPHCSPEIYSACCDGSEFIPLKYIRNLKYALIQKDSVQREY